MSRSLRVPAAAAVEVRDLSKSYGGTTVLAGVALDVAAGGVTAILGASGSGKTTLLRLIAGFDQPDRGQITIAGRVVDDGVRTVRAQHRGVGYVPQDAALFPHLSVAGNVGFGIARRHRRDRVGEMLELVELAGYQRRYPHQLSGGQRQRIALARALATRPSVVLLDEPFGSLDAELRETVRADVLAILRATGTTTVLVTHDQDEALSVSDHVALLDAGRIVARGTPHELYEHPSTPRVALAIGTANVLAGHRDGPVVTCALGVLTDAGDPGNTGPGPCRVLLRPEQLRLTHTPTVGAVPAVVTTVRYHGHDTLLDLTATPDGRNEAVPLSVRVAGRSDLSPGRRVWVTATGRAHTWPAAELS